MNYNYLLVEISENIALVTINRPDKLNALNSELLSNLSMFITDAQKNDEIKTIIITGAGEKAFVAGADIAQINALNVISGKTFAENGQEVFNKIENSVKPVIAAVNGYALGGGCELAMSCHIRFASENAVFGQPEVNLGVIPGYGGTQRMVKLLGTGLASEIILTGRNIKADEALKIGLVNNVFSQSELLEKAKDTAKMINSKGTIAVSMALKAIVTANNSSLTEGLKEEASLFAICCGTEDFKEGTNAFLEKRKPEFKGK